MRKQKKRERTLGQAIGLSLAVTLGVALLIFMVLMSLPGSALHQLYLLIRFNSTATLRSDILFKDWMEKVDVQEAVFVTPFSLLCGGLALGWLSPSYAARRRVLIWAAAIPVGLVTLFLALLWPTAILQQNAMNANAGGSQNYVTAPFEVVRNQIFWGIIWTLVSILGAWGGRALRLRYVKPKSSAPLLKSAGH